MDALDLARWQFGIITVYHFIFVPITIGMSVLVASLQTAWVRTGKEHYLRATKFWGKLFLINFAMGVVTGIVQEFQFGMNWSDYSRFVGDIFGAPLAIEGLLAFFLESTFLGLWIFGWDRLPKRLHLATIWIAAIGTMLSAYFILAANSWMQHPVGYEINTETGRAELNSIGAVLTNSTTLVTFPHTITACFLTAGAVLLAVSAWHLRKRHQEDVFRPSLKLGAWVVLVAGVGVMITGDLQARIMTEQQPMKMAAAEALYETSEPSELLPVHHRLPRRARGGGQRPDTRGALLHGHRQPLRHGRGDQQPATGVRREVRPGRLRAVRADHLLVVPPDDRFRPARHACRGGGALGRARRPDTDEPLAVVLRRRHHLHAAAVQLVRLDLHGDGLSSRGRSSASSRPSRAARPRSAPRRRPPH
nr:hypothetical protein GCM10020092_039510 [Actinoplanes digitatis]